MEWKGNRKGLEKKQKSCGTKIKWNGEGMEINLYLRWNSNEMESKWNM